MKSFGEQLFSFDPETSDTETLLKDIKICNCTALAAVPERLTFPEWLADARQTLEIAVTNFHDTYPSPK